MKVNINTSSTIKFINTLEKLHKSAFPSAVRGSLNKAGYDVKTSTMPSEASKVFEHRQPNFFKANSKFENATGFDIKKMESKVGFVSSGLKGSNNYAVQDLEEQEHGGSINKKSFIPMKPARTGNNNSKNVRSNARLSAIKTIVDSRKATGKTDKERFRKSVYFAGAGGYVLGNKNPTILWRVNSMKRLAGGAFKMTPLYTYAKNRKVNVAATGFMENSSIKSGKKIPSNFIAEAKRQMAKYK